MGYPFGGRQKIKTFISCPDSEELKLYALEIEDNVLALSKLGNRRLTGKRVEEIRLHVHGHGGNSPCDDCMEKVRKSRKLK